MKTLIETIDLNLCIGNTAFIQHLNWQVKPKEIWGILGINGTGKTTLLNSLIGLHKTEKNKVLFNGKPLHTYTSKQLARKIGYLFQHSHDDFPLTLFEHCTHSLHSKTERWKNFNPTDLESIEDALKKVGLYEAKNRFIHTLSGGEKRRLDIACLLIQKPKLWLLDEPVNHLDIHHQISMMDTLITAAKNNNGSVICVLHDANLAVKYCTHVLFLFTDKQHQLGRSEQLLTEERLSTLYQHPIRKICDHNHSAFIAD